MLKTARQAVKYPVPVPEHVLPLLFAAALRITVVDIGFADLQAHVFN